MYRILKLIYSTFSCLFVYFSNFILKLYAFMMSDVVAASIAFTPPCVISGIYTSNSAYILPSLFVNVIFATPPSKFFDVSFFTVAVK